VSEAGLKAANELCDRYASVANSLTEAEMLMPSGCHGWSVKDLVAHASSNFQVMAEPPAPSDQVSSQDAAESAAPLAEEAMSMMVDMRRDWTSEQVLEELNTFTPRWKSALKALQDEPSASVEIAMSELGTYPLHNMADAYAFDIACHLYVDLLSPTGPIDRVVEPLDDAILAPGIGWMITGLPQMCPQVSAVLTRPVGLILTGAGGGEWTLRPGDPLITIESGIAADVSDIAASDAFEFMQWGTCRKPWKGEVSLTGDQEYVTVVLDAINVI
jgi:uncharacterized protein (TIGR03083 family)